MRVASAEKLQLEDQLAHLQLSLDPRVLWPDIGRASLDAALHEIARVTREVVAGGRASLGPAQADEPLRALGVAAFVSGMGPMLGYWIERGSLDADADQQALLRRHYDHGRRRHAMLEARLAGLLDTLRPLGVTPILLKGMDTAQRYLPAPGTRGIGDIDILVRPTELAQARAALGEAGYVEKKWSVRPSRSEWIPAGNAQRIHSLELDHANNPWAIDLHVALERNYHRGLVASLGERAFDAVPLEIAGRPARALAQPVLTAWLAIHAGFRMDQMQLARLVELVCVIRKDTALGTLQWPALTALLGETRTARFAYPALALVEHLVPGTLPPEVIAAGARASTRRARRVVEALAASGIYRLGSRSLDEKLMWARGPLQLIMAWSDAAWPMHSGGVLATGRTQARRVRAVLAGQVRLRAGTREP